MEEWNNGMMGKNVFSIFQYSIIPIFLFSTVSSVPPC
jgi:hypothetical protein